MLIMPSWRMRNLHLLVCVGVILTIALSRADTDPANPDATVVKKTPKDPKGGQGIQVNSGTQSNGYNKMSIYLQRNGHCYYIEMSRMVTWAEAAAICKLENYELVAIETAEENQMLKRFLLDTSARPTDSTTPYHNFWTSGKSSGKGKYRWQANNLFVQNSTMDENVKYMEDSYIYMERMKGYKWSSAHGAFHAFPVCEKIGCPYLKCKNGGVCKCGDFCQCPRTHTGRTCAIRQDCHLECKGDSYSSKDCRYCICPNLSIKGPEVFDANGNPLDSVKLIFDKKPEEILHTYKADTAYEIKKLCEGSKILFTKDGYDTETVVLRINAMPKTVTLFERASVVVPPHDTVVVKGKSFTMCCGTNPLNRPLKWRINGRLSNLQGFTSSRNNLSYSLFTSASDKHRGMYQCMFKGRYSVAVSKPAHVSIVDKDEICGDPSRRIVSLPAKCKKLTFLSMYNAKTCRGKTCVSKSCLTTKGKGVSKCCRPKTYSHSTFSCGDFNFPAITINKCECTACKSHPTLNAVSVKGTVGEIDGKRIVIERAVVAVDGNDITETDNDGTFFLELNVKYERRFVITVRSRDDGTPTFAPHVHVLRLSPNNAPETMVVNIKVKRIQLQTFERASFYTPGNQDKKPIVSFHIPEKMKGEKTGDLLSSIEILDGRIERSIIETPGEFMTMEDSRPTILKFQVVFSVMNFADEDPYAKLKKWESGEIGVFLHRDYVEVSAGLGVVNRIYTLNEETGFWGVTYNHGSYREAPKNMKYIGTFNPSAGKWFAVGVPQYGQTCHVKMRSYISASQMQYQRTRADIVTSVHTLNARSLYIRTNAYFTDSKTLCVPVVCSSKIKFARAWSMGRLAKPAEASDAGISSNEVNHLDLTVNGEESIYTTSKTLIGPPSGNSPIYYGSHAGKCHSSASDSGHLQFYTGPIFPHELSIRPRAILDDPDRNNLTWYRTSKACYIKIRHFGVDDSKLISVTSIGGTNNDTKGQLFGIRKDKTTDRTVCVEYKCSDDIPGEFVDDTKLHVEVVGDRHDCHVVDVHKDIVHAQKIITPPVPRFMKRSGKFYISKDLKSDVIFVKKSEDGVAHAKNLAFNACEKSKKAAVNMRCFPKNGA